MTSKAASRKSRLVVRGLVLLLIGTALACVSAWGPAFLLLEPGLAGGCEIYEYPETWNNPKRCLWLRVWRCSYGTYVQTALLGKLADEEHRPAPERNSLPIWTRTWSTWPARPAGCEEATTSSRAWSEVAYGWPLPCLAAAYQASYQNGAAIPGTVQGGLAIMKYQLPPPTPFPTQTPAVLPLRPWVPGLAADALLYALVIAALRAGLLRLRTRLRLRRGRCPGCGYDLRASPEQCPECGRPVTEARSAGDA